MSDVAVEIGIEASKSTGAIEASGRELDALRQKVDDVGAGAQATGEKLKGSSEALTQLQQAAAQFVTAAAITAFFKEAVSESLKEAEALRVVRGQVEATGQSWGKYREEVERFAAAQQAQTRFDDTVTLEVLGKLTRATGDVASAMRATALAQDISANTGMDLASSTQIINGLLTGQERAVKTAQKELAAYVGTADTTQTVLNALAKNFEGLAAAEESHTKSLAQSRATLADFQQKIGDGIVPVLAEMARWGAVVMKTFEEVGIVIAGQAAAIATAFSGAFEATKAVLSGNFDEAKRLAGQMKDSLVTIAEETAASVSEVEERYKQQRVERVQSTVPLIAKASEDEANAQKQAAERALADAKKRETEEKKLQDEKKRSFQGTMQFISSLASSENKRLAVIGKTAALANAFINTAEAVTVALKSAPPPFNFALAAAVGAAGGAQIAAITATQLEKGGVTPGTSSDGIFAQIGENRKKEGVLPLEDARAMKMVGEAIANAGGGGGGGTVVFQNTFVLPGLEAARDPGLVREIMEAMAEQLQREGPEAILVALRSANLAQRYRGRAA